MEKMNEKQIQIMNFTTAETTIIYFKFRKIWKANSLKMRINDYENLLNLTSNEVGLNVDKPAGTTKDSNYVLICVCTIFPFSLAIN